MLGIRHELLVVLWMEVVVVVEVEAQTQNGRGGPTHSRDLVEPDSQKSVAQGPPYTRRDSNIPNQWTCGWQHKLCSRRALSRSGQEELCSGQGLLVRWTGLVGIPSPTAALGGNNVVKCVKGALRVEE